MTNKNKIKITDNVPIADLIPILANGIENVHYQTHGDIRRVKKNQTVILYPTMDSSYKLLVVGVRPPSPTIEEVRKEFDICKDKQPTQEQFEITNYKTVTKAIYKLESVSAKILSILKGEYNQEMINIGFAYDVRIRSKVFIAKEVQLLQSQFQFIADFYQDVIANGMIGIAISFYIAGDKFVYERNGNSVSYIDIEEKVARHSNNIFCCSQETNNKSHVVIEINDVNFPLCFSYSTRQNAEFNDLLDKALAENSTKQDAINLLELLKSQNPILVQNSGIESMSRIGVRKNPKQIGTYKITGKR